MSNILKVLKLPRELGFIYRICLRNERVFEIGDFPDIGADQSSCRKKTDSKNKRQNPERLQKMIAIL